MNSLSAEILSKITTYLSLHHKLTCIPVCKQWYNIITQSTLYETLEFKRGNPTKFDQALLFFQENIYMGQHVRHLSIKKL
jgi:hypothetical protein